MASKGIAKKSANATYMGDPRRPDRVADFQMVSSDIETDAYALLALFFGLSAVFLHNQLFATITLLFTLSSLANTKHSQADFKGMFSLTTLCLLVFFATNSNKPLLFPFLVKQLRK